MTNAAAQVKAELHQLDVDDLLLDPQNPRLPEHLVGGGQATLLDYLEQNEVLDELARSLADSGYFAHEPLIAVREKPGSKRFHVLEGNRRLATLKLLLSGGQLATDVGLTSTRAKELRSVPCYVVNDRDEAQRYLGFRHIGGLKTWSPEAKARYIFEAVEKATNTVDPFRQVARELGSNTQGIRNYYTAIAILRAAKEDLGLDIRHIQEERFGVWMRCMNSPDFRSHIRFPDARTRDEVLQGARLLNGDAIADVISDMTPQDGAKALLRDSRDVTDYARILHTPSALNVMRKYNSLDLARQVLTEASLPTRIVELQQRCDVLTQEATRIYSTTVPEEATEAAQRFLRSAKGLVAVLQ